MKTYSQPLKWSEQMNSFLSVTLCLLHQLSVVEYSETFSHSVGKGVRKSSQTLEPSTSYYVFYFIFLSSSSESTTYFLHYSTIVQVSPYFSAFFCTFNTISE
jgi:hypothetical protein